MDVESAPSDVESIYSAAGLGHRAERGVAPAVVVVDLQNGFTDPAHPLGAQSDAVVAAARRVLDAARAAERPIIFSVIGYEEDAEHAWFGKMPQLRTLVVGTPWCEVDARLGRQQGEPVITKQAASAAFGTGLAERLRAEGADTVVVVGVTTSGCIRATAVDLVSAGFPVLVPAEAVGDRAEGPHAASLFDIDAKYGDVVSVDDVVHYLEELR